jgi:hypothetical protein
MSFSEPTIAVIDIVSDNQALNLLPATVTHSHPF